ncbi:MAG: hypothetical protein AB2A00_20005 [Myxococcota bacterium]
MRPDVAGGRVLIVDGNAERTARMVEAAESAGFTTDSVQHHRDALSRMRSQLPDVLWVGVVKGTGVADFLDVVRAAYPTLPAIALVDRRKWEEGLSMLEAGAFDLLADDDDPRMHQAALRRAMTDVRARASVTEERGRLLGVQSRVTAMAPAMEAMTAGLSNTLRDSLDLPDVSLRQVETVCAEALSRFINGDPVVMLAYERKAGILRPRVTTHPCTEHDDAAERGFDMGEYREEWQDALNTIGGNEALIDAIQSHYGARQLVLSPLGPPDEPYGAAAYLPNRAMPPSPDEHELLDQLAAHAAHCIRVARYFRVLLRRGGSGPNTISGPR